MLIIGPIVIFDRGVGGADGVAKYRHVPLHARSSQYMEIGWLREDFDKEIVNVRDWIT